MKNLKLEFRNEFTKETGQFKVGNVHIMMTPPLDEDYWIFRVKVHKNQSIIAFPKFGMMGISFAHEVDWNTNLPSSCEAEKIYNWIRVNKGSKSIRKDTCIRAIEILKRACQYYMVNEKAGEVLSNSSQFKSYAERLIKFVEGKGNIDVIDYTGYKNKLGRG